jgi:hypothetical protein
MRVIIEIPDAAGQIATVRQEALGTTAETPSGPTAVPTDQGEAQDGGSPAPSLLFALGAEQAPGGEEPPPQPVNQAGNYDGGGAAPWLVDLITGGAQR